MFVVPMMSIYPSDYEKRKEQYVLNRASTSSASSDASSLHRTPSTNSSGSTSRWSTSSISSGEQNVVVGTKHRKRSSRVSFNLPRPLQPFHKKVQSQPQARLPQSPRSQPPPRPPRPDEVALRPVERKWSAEIQKPVQAPPPPPPPPPPVAKRPEKLRKRSESAPQLPPTPPSPSTEWQCSDLVVRCKADVYHVDRTIMCYHSKWFARVCAIMTTPKASKSVIDLSADDPEAVAAMMQYCYQLDYTDKSIDPSCAVDEMADLMPHVDIYMLAERYGMLGLKRLALEKFEALATMVLKVSGDEEQFLQAVRAMYAPTRRANADDLRRVAVQICADHVQGFISGSHTTMAMVFESMDSLPEFRSDLFEEMALRWK